MLTSGSYNESKVKGSSDAIFPRSQSKVPSVICINPLAPTLDWALGSNPLSVRIKLYTKSGSSS